MGIQRVVHCKPACTVYRMHGSHHGPPQSTPASWGLHSPSVQESATQRPSEPVFWLPQACPSEQTQTSKLGSSQEGLLCCCVHHSSASRHACSDCRYRQPSEYDMGYAPHSPPQSGCSSLPFCTPVRTGWGAPRVTLRACAKTASSAQVNRWQIVAGRATAPAVARSRCLALGRTAAHSTQSTASTDGCQERILSRGSPLLTQCPHGWQEPPPSMHCSSPFCTRS